jgi:hypothetical protein
VPPVNICAALCYRLCAALSDLNFCFMALIGILFFSSAANWAHYYITSHIESTALGCNLEHGRGHFAGAASQFRKSTQKHLEQNANITK